MSFVPLAPTPAGAWRAARPQREQAPLAVPQPIEAPPVVEVVNLEVERAEARAEGYAAGLLDGEATAAATWRARAEAAEATNTALTQALVGVDRLRAERIDAASHQIGAIVYRWVERVLGEALVEPQRVVALARDITGRLPDHDDIVVRVLPELTAAVSEALAKLPVTVVGDPDVGPGLVVLAEPVSVELTRKAAMEAVDAALDAATRP